MILVLGIAVIALMGVFMSAALANQSDALAKAIVGFFQGFGPLGNFLGGLVGGPVQGLANWIAHEMGVAFQKVEQLGVRWLSGLNQYLNYMAEHGLGWAAQLLRTSLFLQTWFIPQMIRRALRTVEAEIVALYKHMPLPGHIVIRLPKISRAQVRAAVAALLPAAIAHDLPLLAWLRKNFHALTAVLPHTLPIPFGRTIAQIKRRLHRLERALPGTALFAGAVAVALGRLGIAWVRCNNVRRVGRTLCGLNPRTITDLLGFFADVLILTNICRVFTVLEQGLGFIQPQITAFIGGVGAWACYGDNESPPRLAVPPLDLPSSLPVHGLPV